MKRFSTATDAHATTPNVDFQNCRAKRSLCAFSNENRTLSGWNLDAKDEASEYAWPAFADGARGYTAPKHSAPNGHPDGRARGSHELRQQAPGPLMIRNATP